MAFATGVVFLLCDLVPGERARKGRTFFTVPTPDSDTFTLSGVDARRRALQDQFPGGDYPLAIQFLACGKGRRDSIVTHGVGLQEACGVFAAPAEARPVTERP